MQTVHLVHGFNVSDGGVSTLDKLRPYFERRGFLVCEHDTKWSRGLIRDLLNVRFGNSKRAEKLAESIKPGDILVGHSNGCAIISIACWILAQMNPAYRVRCVFFNPALDRDFPVSPIISHFLLFHTRSDRVVQLSKLLRWHRWGDAGRVGYYGGQGQKAMNCAYETLGLPNLGHSGVFKDEKNLHVVMEAFDDWTREIEFQLIL